MNELHYWDEMNESFKQLLFFLPLTAWHLIHTWNTQIFWIIHYWASVILCLWRKAEV